MARKIAQLGLLSALLLHTEAYKLSFYVDAGNCAGEFLGSWVGGPDQGCQTEFVGNAASVVIESTGPADDNTNTIARFYSSPNCQDGTQISEGNVGCVGVDGGGFGSYQSFKIDHTPLGDLPIASSAFSATSTITASGTSIEARSVQTATQASVMPTASPEPAPFVHGEISYHQGIPYRWHQVHASGFMGIHPDEWDDNVHVQNLSPPPSVAEFLANYNLSTRATLDDRALTDLCQFAATCTNRLFGGATFGAQALAGTVEAYWTQVAALAKAQGVKISDFMGNRPFFQSITSNFIAGIPSGLATNWLGSLLTSTNPNNIANCSAIQTQLDAILSALSAHTVTLTETSSVTVTALDTVTNTVTITQMSILKCGQFSEGDQCGLPTGRCLAKPGE